MKLREFYSSLEMKPKIVRTRFCFEMFQVIDREPEFFSILTEDLRCFPVVSQIRAKHCQFSKRRISIMYFEKCKMIYLTESSFKLWNDPYLCEQFIFKNCTVLARRTTKPGYLPNCKKFVFENSTTNNVDFVTKPFNGKTMKEYVLRFSETCRRKTVDPLYTLTWIQTRPRFKLLQSIDLEGRITESNLVFLVANIAFYPCLNIIRLENGTT